MADLNLLQNQLKADSSFKLRKYVDYLQMLLMVLVVVAILAGVGFFVWNRSSVKSQAENIKKVEQRKIDLEASLSDKRDRVVKTQAQLQNAATLFQNRLYWTNFMEVINSATVTGIRFKQLSGGSDGTATITGLVPDLPTLALFTQKLNNLEGVSQVVLNSSSLSSSSFEIFYNFTLTITFDPQILKYNQGAPL